MAREDDIQRTDRSTSDIAREEAQRSGRAFADERRAGESGQQHDSGREGMHGTDRQSQPRQGGQAGSGRQRPEGDRSGASRAWEREDPSGAERERQEGGSSGFTRQEQTDDLSGAGQPGTWTHSGTEAGEQGRSRTEEDEDLRDQQTFE